MQKSRSRSQSREPFFESLCIGIKKFGLVKKVSVSKKALDRFDHNCFSNGCTQYFSLSGKFQQISATDCPPGTDITSAEECRDAGVYLRKQWLHQWGKTLTHLSLQQTKLTNIRLLSRWPYQIGFQYASNTPPCPLRKMFLHGMETWT